MSGFKSVVVGDGLLLVQCANILLERSHTIELVATANPHIRNWADQRQLAVIHPDELEDAVTSVSCDWLFSIANLRILPSRVLQRARCGAINFHDALLPDQGGLNTPAWAILEGRTCHGVTWHAMTRNIDAGDIYIQSRFDIAADETAFTLNSKCFEAGIDTFAELIPLCEQGTIRPSRPASTPGRSYLGSDRPGAAATLDFTEGAGKLERIIRALDFGESYPNPLAAPKVRHKGRIFIVERISIINRTVDARPGSIIECNEAMITVATADKPVLLKLKQPQFETWTVSSTFRPGEVISAFTDEEVSELDAAVMSIARHESHFIRMLTERTDVHLNEVKEHPAASGADWETIRLSFLEQLEEHERIAIICSFLGRTSQQEHVHIAYRNDRLADFCSTYPGFFSDTVPLPFRWDEHMSPGTAVEQIKRSLHLGERRLTYLSDLTDRYREISAAPLTCAISNMHTTETAGPVFGSVITFQTGTRECNLLYDRARLAPKDALSISDRLEVFAHAFHQGEMVLGDLPLMGDAEQQTILYEWNRTEKDYEQTKCAHQLIERQSRLTPDAEAICSGEACLTYGQLEDRANQIAAVLRQEGVGPETIVGLHLPRTIDLAIAAIAVWKAGGAYLPLDPDFPQDRLSYMVRDSNCRLVLASHTFPVTIADCAAEVMYIEDLADKNSCSLTPVNVGANNLAYVIYTSGSTGLPKGVMVEHRNVANFFVGMDDRVPLAPGCRNVWLAVTSLSFDISVLELFWTLSRGFKVIIHSPEITVAKSQARASHLQNDLSFGLFYWGNDSSAGPEKYRLLLEGAKFADSHGFDAIWTPERHFHAFGGPFPNPAVTGAAVAAVTHNLAIRAGSCVLPLHHPIRVAEEWAVVDNLSNGRVGLACASGWMPEDFVIRPENKPPINKGKLISDIDILRQLWRGEEVEFNLGDQKIGVVTQPRPVQRELPIWLTTAGNPESYRNAARSGSHVLTHLLGQSIAELSDKIAIYREELRTLGKNPADFKVTLMLHTLIGDDRETVRELARQPMKDYLESATALIKQYAWAFPAFKKPAGVAEPPDIDLRSLTREELDAILEFSFQRYFEDSGLFGTIEDALDRLAEVRAAGVDEIACLIDWGLPESLVLDGLRPLASVISRYKQQQEKPGDPRSFADEVLQHQVTHLQATPSMIRSFMISEKDQYALSKLKHILIGGEALHGSLVTALKKTTVASVENMYGPTETTIWSSSLAAPSCIGIAPIGRPIANTQLYILDDHMRPVTPGQVGELYIGGDGVTRGYLNREELTRERYRPNPFAGGKVYRTGDLARFDANGVAHFIGRNDNQIKIRGYRMELGEIEAQIASYSGILEAIVTAHTNVDGDTSLIAYVRTKSSDFCQNALRNDLRNKLPEAMIPSSFVTLDAFPLTPNAKVDRNRLPMPSRDAQPVDLPPLAPSEDLEQALCLVFARTLGRDSVTRNDNFFNIGGHSLLAVQMHRTLKESIAPKLTITDVFRFPTVAGLAAHLTGDDGEDKQMARAADRAAMRRQARQERQSRPRTQALV